MIPLIDVSPLFAAAAAARDAADRAVMAAATGAGFMAVTAAPGLLPTGQPTRAELLRVFALADAERAPLLRRAFAPDNRALYRGWFPLQDGVGSYKEGIDIGPDVADPLRAEGGPEGDPLREPTPLPDEAALPGWWAAAAAYYAAMEHAGGLLMQSLARSLGLAEHFFDAPFADGISTLRLIHYPPRRPESFGDQEAKLWVEHGGEPRYLLGGAHVDSGFVTLLAQDGVAGLQAEDAAGRWVDVPPAEGTLVVNFGGLLERWTGGRIRATRHRVIGFGQPRHSIPFFYEPSAEATVRTLPLPGAPEVAPFCYGDHLWAAMLRFPEFRGLAHGRRAACRPEPFPTQDVLKDKFAPAATAGRGWDGMSDPDGRSGTAGLKDVRRPSPAAAARIAADLAPADEAAPEDAPAQLPRHPGRLRRAAAALLRFRARDDSVLTPRRLARGLSRRTRWLAMARLRRLPCFRAADYVQAYNDLADARMDLHFHALFVGGFEERTLFRPETLARCLGAPLATARPLPAPTGRSRVAVHVSSLGNAFMHEIAADIAANLRAADADVDLLDETAPAGRPGALRVFVAPHEFFLLGGGVAWVRDDIVAGSVMLNTEQAQTRWFGRALPFLLASRGVIDLCPQTEALFAAAGLPSLHLTPAPLPGADDLTAADRLHPLFRVLPAAAKAAAMPDAPFAARPIDVAFFGTESRQREAWLSRHAAALADFDCVIHYRREDRGPIRPGSPDGALTRLARHVGGHAKILLNLHRDAFGYLEWHRIVRQGLATGAVVVSEPCLPHPLLTPGVHYLEAAGRQIPDLIGWLVRSEDGRRAAAQVQANGRALLATAITPQASAARVLGFLHAHAQPVR